MSNLKIRDLSVGDWVKIDIYPTPYKIIDLSSRGYVWLLGRNRVAPIRVIEPIPITPEILKSNGWYEDDYDTCTDYITDNTIIMYNKERKDWKACVMNGSPVVRVKVFFSYVHELQHALRLAGLDEDIRL